MSEDELRVDVSGLSDDDIRKRIEALVPGVPPASLAGAFAAREAAASRAVKLLKDTVTWTRGGDTVSWTRG